MPQMTFPPFITYFFKSWWINSSVLFVVPIHFKSFTSCGMSATSSKFSIFGIFLSSTGTDVSSRSHVLILPHRLLKSRELLRKWWIYASWLVTKIRPWPYLAAAKITEFVVSPVKIGIAFWSKTTRDPGYPYKKIHYVVFYQILY